MQITHSPAQNCVHYGHVWSFSTGWNEDMGMQSYPTEQAVLSPEQNLLLQQHGIESHWLRPASASRTLLVCYAHPDDESFAAAGIIAQASAAGIAVHCVCATRGEEGTVSPRHLTGYADVAALRTEELLCAAQSLGVAGVHFLGHRDSGMVGSAANANPSALSQAPLGDVAGQIVALIRTLKPQVVLTHNPAGGYGHPDHIVVHRAMMEAFKAAANATAHAGHGVAPWAPQKLYYDVPIPRSLLRAAIAVMRLLRKNPQRYGTNADIDLMQILAGTLPTTTTVNIRPFFAQKLRAWQCHASQFGKGGPFAEYALFLRRFIFGTERFTRALPAWKDGEQREHYLFAGVHRDRG